MYEWCIKIESVAKFLFQLYRDDKNILLKYYLRQKASIKNCYSRVILWLIDYE